ncbi:MAG: ribbon-helix-helix domain-containing protein [Fimbriimonadales bacterium]
MKRVNFTLDEATLELLDEIAERYYHSNKSLTVRAALESLATHLGHNGWVIAGFTPVVAESEAECHSCHHTYPPGTTLYRPVFTRGRAQNALQEIPKEVWLECSQCVDMESKP